MTVTGIDAIRSRVDALSGRTSTAATTTVPSLGSVAEFDAFGDTYLAALESRDRAGIVHQPQAAVLPAAGSAASFAGTTPGVATSGYATSGYAPGGSYPGATLPGLQPGRVIATPSTSSIPGHLLVGTMSSGIPGSAGPNDAQIAAAVAGQAGPPGVRAVGGYGKMPVPDVLRALGNGKIPPSALIEISQGGHRLYAPAAASWNNMVAAARAEGIELRLTDSYRDYDEQVDLVRRKGLYSQGGLAATPGTSNHGWGMAVDADVTDPRTRNWLQVNGPRFGWVESVPREPWHWEFRPHQV